MEATKVVEDNATDSVLSNTGYDVKEILNCPTSSQPAAGKDVFPDLNVTTSPRDGHERRICQFGRFEDFNVDLDVFLENNNSRILLNKTGMPDVRLSTISDTYCVSQIQYTDLIPSLAIAPLPIVQCFTKYPPVSSVLI